MNKYTVKNILILILIIIILIVIFIFVKNKIDEKNEEIIDHYEVNEYVPVYVDNEAMSKIYLADYINKLYEDIEEAYNLLDKDKTNFDSLDEFSNYISTLNLTTLGSQYSITNSGEYKIFKIIDKNNNTYYFKTNGVLDYKVYFTEEE